MAIESLDAGRTAAQFLRHVRDPAHNRIPTEVMMSAPGNRVYIKGTHCGFFTTSLIHTGILDVRRTLAFLRLKFDKSITSIESNPEPGREDDLFITDLGLAAPTPEDLFEVSMRVIGKPGINELLEVRRYANKELAHFSTSIVQPELVCLADAMTLMRESILYFVYDELSLPRPRARLTVTDEG